MKRVVAIIATLVLLAVGVFLATRQKDAPAGAGEFQAFATVDGEEVVSEVPVDPNDPSKGVRKTTRKTVRKLVERPEEEVLSDPGPTGAAAEARRVVNKRPRTDDDPAPGAEPVATLGKEDIRKGIEAVRPLVQVCYEETLEEFPDAAGKVTIGFRIIGEDDKGRVEMTELADDGTTLFDGKLHECLQKRISEAEFESPSGGGAVTVRYPFVFATDEEE